MCMTGQPPAAMYSLISRLNHSCRANTAYHFKAGGAVVVRAVVDIEPDEELCISYLDPIQPLSRYILLQMPAVQTYNTKMFLCAVYI